jgi:hypothetical protein
VKKFALGVLLGCVAICGGVFSLSQESSKSLTTTGQTVEKGKTSTCPIEQAKTSIKVKADGVYEVSYTMKILQKGITKAHVKPGYIINHPKKGTGLSKKVEFFRLTPKNYVFDETTKHNVTLSHCSGKTLLRLSRGDLIRIGLVTVPITLLYPQAIVKHSTLSLKITPYQ